MLKTLVHRNVSFLFRQHSSVETIGRVHGIRSSHSSSHPSPITIDEIVIPNGKEHSIACKIWRGSTGSESEPPTICIHGWLDNAGTFDALLPSITRPGRSFYTFDLPGHGLSSHIPGTHYNIHTETHLLIHRIVQHFKFKKFNLMGHSMGAEACVIYAACYPEGVQKIVSIDGVKPESPSWVYSVKVFTDALFATEEYVHSEKAKDTQTYEELLNKMMKVRQDGLTEEGCRILLRRGAKKISDNRYRFSHDVKLRLLPGLAMLTKEQFIEFCVALEVPICILKANQNDGFSQKASDDFLTCMEMAKNENPNLKAQFHSVNGNHHIHLNNPENIDKIIDQFLAS